MTKVQIPTPRMGELLADPLEDGALRFVIDSRIRATITSDGKVVDGQGTLIAYIEASGEVGDVQMNYVGKSSPDGLQVSDHDDTLVGEFDVGRGVVKDMQGSVLAECDRGGAITNNAG